MGNLVADAMLDKYAGEAEAAYTNSGGLRADLPCSPPSAGEGDCVITLGELFAVLPFGNSTVIETLTGAQMKTAFINGFGPSCGNAWRHRPVPADRRAQGRVPLRRHRRPSSTACGRRPGRQRAAHAGRRRRHASASSPTTSCTPAATATRSSSRGRTWS